MELAETCLEDNPLCIQLYGSSTDRMCEAARWAEDRGCAVIDINMGCPVDKVTKKDGGSKLLCDPDNTLRMVQRVISVLKHTPLTAKLRLGWDDNSIVAPQLAKRLEEVGIAMVTIHGRTTEMRFSGQARLDGIAQVVASVKNIPVIGNGDIRTPEDAKRMIDTTGCRGVMIARGALSAPWLLRDIWNYLSTGVIPDPPSVAEKCGLIRDHFNNMLRFRNERVAINEMRKRISWYSKTMAPCKMLKEQMQTIASPPDFENVLERFLEWRLERDEQVKLGRQPELEPVCAGAD
jgi:nifR3 family TIM-barrel protein